MFLRKNTKANALTGKKTVKRAMALALASSMVIGGVFTVQAAGLKDAFDAKTYSETYADLSAAFGTNEQALYNHFITYGLDENRTMSELIDVKKYRAAYPDLDAAFGDNWDAYVDHYVRYGAREGRENFGTFDAYAYADRYADLKAVFGYDVLALWNHYVTLGRDEQRCATTECHCYDPVPAAGSSSSGSEAPSGELVAVSGRLVDPETGAPIAGAVVHLSPVGDTPVVEAIAPAAVLAAEDDAVASSEASSEASTEESSEASTEESSEASTEESSEASTEESSEESSEEVESTEESSEESTEESTPETTPDVEDTPVVEDPYTAITDANGNYLFSLPAGTYTATVTAEGYMALTMDTLVVNDAESSVVPTVTLLSESAEGETRIAGRLTDALTGEGMADATVELRANWGNYTGEVVVTATTDADGNYSIDVERGYYTATYSKEGYVTKSQNVVSVTNYTSYLQNEAMTPEVAADSYRVVLTWGETPSDLDSHITGPADNGEAFHVYFGDRSYSENGEDIVTLDHDDVTSYGPETVTVITPEDNAIYRYSVHNFSGETDMALSGASVVVYAGSELVATFNIPTTTGQGNIWNVFEIRDGQLFTLNTFTQGHSGSDAYYADALYTE